MDMIMALFGAFGVIIFIDKEKAPAFNFRKKSPKKRKIKTRKKLCSQKIISFKIYGLPYFFSFFRKVL